MVALKSRRRLNNGQPSVVAACIAALRPCRGDSVLHVGCGGGYYTAILAELAGESGHVIAAEIDPKLAGSAAAHLRGYANVEVRNVDGEALEAEPWDAILVSAGVNHPATVWLNSLNEGGRLVFPLTVATGTNVGNGFLVKATRGRAGFSAEVFSSIAIYSSASCRDPVREARLTEAMKTRELMRLRSLRVDLHDPEDTCIVHAPPVCLSSISIRGRQ